MSLDLRGQLDDVLASHCLTKSDIDLSVKELMLHVFSLAGGPLHASSSLDEERQVKVKRYDGEISVRNIPVVSQLQEYGLIEINSIHGDVWPVLGDAGVCRVGDRGLSYTGQLGESLGILGETYLAGYIAIFEHIAWNHRQNIFQSKSFT